MIRRTTVVAEDEDLVLLTREAKERGMSLGRFLGGLVAERAEQLRQSRRPRVGLFSADVSIAELMEQEEMTPPPFRP